MSGAAVGPAPGAVPALEPRHAAKRCAAGRPHGRILEVRPIVSSGRLRRPLGPLGLVLAAPVRAAALLVRLLGIAVACAALAGGVVLYGLGWTCWTVTTRLTARLARRGARLTRRGGARPGAAARGRPDRRALSG
jgi:hypothetical protein